MISKGTAKIRKLLNNVANLVSNRRFTRQADVRLSPGCYGNLTVNVKRGQSRPTCLWGRPRETRLGHVHIHDYRRGTFVLCRNDERIVAFLKRVRSFLLISYWVTDFFASQPTSPTMSPFRVNRPTHNSHDYRKRVRDVWKSARSVNRT